MLSTIARTGDVLQLFTSERPEWGVRDVAQTLQVPKSNVHDLLASLVAIGLLRRTHESRYRLGWRLLGLTETLLAGDRLHRMSASVIGDLATHTGESVQLSVPHGAEAVVVSRAIGGRAATIGINIGDTLPQHATAAGKLLSAHLRSAPPPILDRLTTATIVDPLALETEYRRIRRADVAMDHGEAFEGVSCVAAAVRDTASGRVVGSVSISTPDARFATHRQLYGRAVVTAARRLSALASPGAADRHRPAPPLDRLAEPGRR